MHHGERSAGLFVEKRFMGSWNRVAVQLIINCWMDRWWMNGWMHESKSTEPLVMEGWMNGSIDGSIDEWIQWMERWWTDECTTFRKLFKFDIGLSFHCTYFLIVIYFELYRNEIRFCDQKVSAQTPSSAIYWKRLSGWNVLVTNLISFP